jgi:demethylmenaquinone methyltransferase/2-methoxy-6-polyprenyl-1,4-benzoquinol methylase
VSLGDAEVVALLKHQQDIYSPEFVRDLFDEMSHTYGAVNLLSSFGFCVRWRRQCLEQVPIHAGDVVFDLLSGMGELWPGLAAKVGRAGRICALDFSPAMCARSRRTAGRLPEASIDLRQEDVLRNSLADSSAEVVVSSFGLKTFTSAQRARLAREVARILRPGGTFSFLEISVPPLALLRWPYMAYLNYIVPWIGRLLLGNPDNYRLLGVYTAAHRDCREFAQHCTAAGLRAVLSSFFFGCATGVVGQKPDNAEVAPAADRPANSASCG